ncbi:MAG: 16S rRNA (cytosine(1402)-N(4))-methyltransferase RsmH, partial [Pseudomonadota bacterium]
PPHIPVLLTEVIDALAPTEGEHYVDATFGAGGYARAILDTAACRVTGLDRDPTAIAAAAGMVADYTGRLQLIETAFADMAHVVAAPVDGVVFDLGVSSMQLDQAERGFSFQKDGPLDMRMAAHGDSASAPAPPSAADLVNQADEATLADILFHYGEERRARAIAGAIVARRDGQPFARTLDLANLVERVLGRRPQDARHPATRTFQALRIAVNRELEQVAEGLDAAEAMLRPGGRLVLVTFHSLEDRLVKRWLAERSAQTGGGGSRHLPEHVESKQISFELINRRPLTPSRQETADNPRARSAKLRAACRTDAAPAVADADALGVRIVDWSVPATVGPP